MNPEEVFGIRALNLGASGYLSKDIALEQLVPAIRRVASGKVFISQVLAESIAQNISRGSPKLPHEHLSDREYQIMIMIAKGKSLKAIGAELSVSVKTISTHRTHIMEKMKLENNAQIVTYALQNGLLT
jgi:DNA-binding NarL/FixJ family response regulator